MRLLVVEDEKKVASFIKQGLAEEGYAVDVALDGQEGLEMARDPVHDLIILDISLPKMDGLQVLKKLRQQKVNTPVLLLTVRATIEDKVLGLDAGGGGWMLALRALRPVDRMTETTRRISAEHLTGRLDETGAGDELDRLAQTLNAMLGRLDAAFKEMRQFTADASHELQTPLTILKGEMEVALRSPRSPEEYQRILKSALEEIDKIARLVEGLLLLARADAGVLRMDQRPVDLGQLVEEVYGQARILAEARSINLGLGPVEPVSAQGDYTHLRRLLLNLVDNGIKYTPPGGNVTISLQSSGGWASIRVEDTGIGIPKEDQARIFQRFYRSPEARSRAEGGAGLGLCIARSIAEAHGGRIEVESIAGRGSTFTVLLPTQS